MAKTIRFIVSGDESVAYGLRDMLNANRDDEDLCEWLVQAKPGDKYPCGEGCECIAGLPASWLEVA